LRIIGLDVDQYCINFPAEPWMSRNGALPIYLQISEMLIRDIAAGRMADGSKLPPERSMAADLGVALGTLRAALSEMAARGMLVRVQGSGNYVRARPNPEAVYALFRLERVEGGGLPTAEVLSVVRLPKDPRLPGFGPHREGHRIRRLRFLSGQVSALEEIWLDASHAERIEPSELSASLYLFYRKRLGLWISGAEDQIGQGPLPDWAPAAFPHAPGSLLPMITRIARAPDGAPVEASWTWFDPRTTRYVARLK
jgi:GntR family transcriptional regulator